jgi:hypothetical protein
MLRAQHGEHGGHEARALSAPPLRITVRKMLADVAEARSAQQRIAQSMQDHVPVRVRAHTVRVRDTHAPEHDELAGTEGVYVEA